MLTITTTHPDGTTETEIWDDAGSLFEEISDWTPSLLAVDAMGRSGGFILWPAWSGRPRFSTVFDLVRAGEGFEAKRALRDLDWWRATK